MREMDNPDPDTGQVGWGSMGPTLARSQPGLAQ